MSWTKPLLIKPVLKNYAWGKTGPDSFVARLSGAKQSAGPFAELWYGSHPSGPAQLIDQSIANDLHTLLKHNELPFLFKVLSIAEPLSIQVHPTKDQAKFLHKKDPKNYPDQNHKPELVIALTPLTMLHGFKTGPLDKAEIAKLLRTGPKEARKLIQDRLAKPSECASTEVWIKKFAGLYPEDPGVLLIDLMNLITLVPGEAIFTEPGTLHAYLEGEALECMASSDNVVRAGLTNKPKDIEALLEITNFSPAAPKIIEAQHEPSGLAIYEAAISEFKLSLLRPSVESKKPITLSGPALVVCIEGFANLADLKLQAGQAAFIPLGLRFATIKSTEGLTVIIC